MDETTAVAGHGRRRWLPIALVAFVLLALLAASLVFADREAPERVARFVAAAKAEWLAWTAVRPARGGGGAGSAWQQHERSLRIVAAWPQALRDIDTMSELGAAEDAIAWRDHRGLVPPLFAALREAADCPDVRRPMETNADPEAALTLADLGRVACRELAARVDQGALGDAVDGSLDLATFVGDLAGHWSTLVQLQALVMLGGLCELWTPGRVARLSAEGRDRLAAGLAELDRRLPWELPLQYDLAATAESLMDPEAPLEQFGGRLESWRHGFSPRLMLCAAIEELRTLYASLPGAAPNEPWSQRGTQLRRIEAAARASANQWVRRLGCNVVDCERVMRRERAGLRLLCLDLAWRSGRELPELVDPTADGPIVAEVDAGQVTLRVADPEVPARVVERH